MTWATSERLGPPAEECLVPATHPNPEEPSEALLALASGVECARDLDAGSWCDVAPPPSPPFTEGEVRSHLAGRLEFARPGVMLGNPAGRYDLFEDVIVKLRYDGTLSKAEQHAQCQRVWDAALGSK